MSWLRQNISQSISGGISQLSGQLKEILNEGTEEIIDPKSEIKGLSEKLKENERLNELLKMENTRMQEELNELNVKCQTYENQLEIKHNEYRASNLQKDAQISELTKQVNVLQSSAKTVATIGSNDFFQKSSLMEDFEELMPQTEFSDYIHLQKEIKRLNEDNLHFSNENKQLLNRLKTLELTSNTDTNNSEDKKLDTIIENLKQEIFNLQSRLEAEKDKHQEEIIAVQYSYKDRLSTQINEFQNENESLREQLEELQLKLNEKQKDSTLEIKISSNKSDDGWCINDLEENTDKIEVVKIENGEMKELKKQIESLQSEIDQANAQIIQLKKSDKIAKQHHKSLIDELNTRLKEFESANSILNETIKSKEEETHSIQEQCDLLNLELKNLQQTINHEKLLQMQEQKKEKQSVQLLTNENAELKSKLDEKINEINLLANQVNELNESINNIKSNDSNLFTELELKTKQFVYQLDQANSQTAHLKIELENVNEQRKQFEFVLDEKTRENCQLKNDIKKHLQHIEAQAKALEKLQIDSKNKENEDQTKLNEQSNDELAFFKQQYNQIYGYLEQKSVESLGYYNEIQRLNVVLSDLNRELNNEKSLNESLHEQYETLVKEFQAENQKMVDDLNKQTSELNATLMSTTNAVAAQLQSNTDQSDNIKQESSLELDKIKKEIEEDLLKQEQHRIEMIQENNKQIIEQMEFEINQLKLDKENVVEKFNSQIELQEKQMNNKLNETVDFYETQVNSIKKDCEQQVQQLASKMNETIQYYEEQLKLQNENLNSLKQTEDSQIQRLNKELKRLKEHLVEMSDNYNNEAIQAEEREKQLRLALNDAQKNLQKQDETLESSSKEIEQKLEHLTKVNTDLKNEKENMKDLLKKSEQNYNHQIKVTKNLELVLERLQNEKDNQHSIEINNYQQTIKEQSSKIYTLQKEAKNYLNEIDNMKEALNEMNLLDIELKQKDDSIKHLKAQIGTKDALIESLDKRVNEIQKLNNTYIEKDIIKSLIIGYIKVTQVQEKKQVLKLISTMLNFTPQELEQAESSNESSKWFGISLTKTPNKSSNSSVASLVTPEGTLNKSFTELLIQYVDRESKPKPNFAFDLNNPNLSHKKTDGPDHVDSKQVTSSLLNSTGTDLTLINRNFASNQAEEEQQKSSSIISAQLTSPAMANSFIEQILK